MYLCPLHAHGGPLRHAALVRIPSSLSLYLTTYVSLSSSCSWWSSPPCCSCKDPILSIPLSDYLSLIFSNSALESFQDPFLSLSLYLNITTAISLFSKLMMVLPSMLYPSFYLSIIFQCMVGLGALDPSQNVVDLSQIS